jgi:hypothetical protein
MRKLIFLLFALVTASGCVSAYKGPGPDVKLQGEDARKEYEKFAINQSWWGPGPGFFEMGQEGVIYTAESLEPVFESVSPEAAKLEDRSRNWMLGARIVILGAVVYYFSTIDENENKFPMHAVIALAGAGVAIRAQGLHNKAAETYNRDLKQRFSPALTYNWNF